MISPALSLTLPVRLGPSARCPRSTRMKKLEHWTSVLPVLGRNDSVVLLECGGRAQRRRRFGFFCPRRSHPLKSTCNPNQPMVLPLLGAADEVSVKTKSNCAGVRASLYLQISLEFP